MPDKVENAGPGSVNRRRFAILVLIVAVPLGVLLLRTDSRLPEPREDEPVESAPEQAPIVDLPDQALPQVADHNSVRAEPADLTDDADECAARFDGVERPSRAERKEAVNSAAETLRASGVEDHLLAAAMIEKSSDPEHSLQLLRQLGGESSAGPVAVLAMMNVCERQPSLDCDFAALESNIRMNHWTNGALWLGLAGEMLRDDRPDEAIDAVRQAIVAPTFETYLSEQIMTVERGLAASTDWSLTERVFHSVEYGFSTPPQINQVVSQCESESGGEWFVLCDLLADRMIANERDIIALGTGIELKRRFLMAREDSVGLDELEKHKTQLIRVMGEQDEAREAFNALLNDENLLRNFLENFEVAGEMEAFRQLSVDVARLKNTEGYDQCNFVANPYIESRG